MIQLLLLAGQVLVVALLYLFIWRVMRAARSDLRVVTMAAPQDSTIIPAAEMAQARRAAGLADARVVVERSPHLREGQPFTIGQEGLTLGRSSDNDIVLDDGFVSSHHLKLQPPNVLIDLESTNGTVVNGKALIGRVRLHARDTIQVGDTIFRYEGSR